MCNLIALGIPQVPVGKNYHPGGQLTAANGLVDYLMNRGIKFDVLNTVATVFPPVPLWKKILQSLGRIYKARHIAANTECCGFITFSGFGLSLYERCCIAFIFRIYQKPSVIFFRSTELLDRPISEIERNILSLVLRIPTTVVSQGTLLANELKHIGCKSVVIIPNWLPTGYSVACQPKFYPTNGIVDFVFVGWLEDSKGIPELIEAVAILKPIANRFRLLLVGSGSLEREVANSISNLGLSNIVSLGWMEQKEVIGILDCSHVFILPSHTEGFPNALLEAMANGLPVITTRVGAIPDSVKRDVNGLFVDIKDAQSISEIMRRYIEDVELIPRQSKQAIEVVKHYHSLDINCEKLINLLKTTSHGF